MQCMMIVVTRPDLAAKPAGNLPIYWNLFSLTVVGGRLSGYSEADRSDHENLMRADK